MGKMPVFMLTDMNLVKQVMVQDFQSFINRRANIIRDFSKLPTYVSLFLIRNAQISG